MKSTVLIIDDSHFVRTANQKALARAGYQVLVTADGQHGLQMAQDRRPDLILLDMMLPKLSGPEVLRALKNDPRTDSIPVIVLTGLSGKNKLKLLKDGAHDFVGKTDDLLKNDSAIVVHAVQAALHAITKSETPR